MPQIDPETALGEAVASLALLDGEDIAMILAILDADDRRIIEELLERLPSSFEKALDQRDPEPDYEAAGLSPWLLQRIRSKNAAELGITSVAQEVLQQCATEFCHKRLSGVLGQHANSAALAMGNRVLRREARK